MNKPGKQASLWPAECQALNFRPGFGGRTYGGQPWKRDHRAPTNKTPSLSCKHFWTIL